MSFTCRKPENDGYDVNSPMKEGDYEVILKEAKYTQTKSGIPCIFFDWVVRNDVEQAYKNRHIFKRYYQDNEGDWPADKLCRAAYALGVPEGAVFDVDDLAGRCCRAHVKPYTCKGGDGTERTIDTIAYYAASEAWQAVQTIGRNEGYMNVEDDDFPF